MLALTGALELQVEVATSEPQVTFKVFHSAHTQHLMQITTALDKTNGIWLLG